MESCLPRSHLFHHDFLCRLLAASAGPNSRWVSFAPSFASIVAVRRRQNPRLRLPHSLIFLVRFWKNTLLRKPLLVVHIHLDNYSDTYTLSREQAYRILTIPSQTTITMKLASVYLSVIAFSGRAYVYSWLSIVVVY